MLGKRKIPVDGEIGLLGLQRWQSEGLGEDLGPTYPTTMVWAIEQGFSGVFYLANRRSEVDWCMGWYERLGRKIEDVLSVFRDDLWLK